MTVAETQLGRHVRDALANLYDPVALRRHPLASVHADLPDRLIAAIEILKPGPKVERTARAWRPYRILRARYVDALDPIEVQRQLAIGKSQYYREHEAAVAALIKVLEEQGWAETRGQPETAKRSRRALVGPAAVAFAVVIVLLGVVFYIRAWPVALPTSGSLSVYAGTGQAGHANGAASIARFAGPFGLAVDDSGNVYVADTGNHRIRIVGPSGLVLDYAGSGIEGFADGPKASAQFSSPNAVTVGPDGTVYVGDAGNVRVRAVNPSGTVSTLAGSGSAGYVDAAGTEAQFTVTGAVVADRSGNVYVPDRINNVVRRITPGGTVSRYAGTGARGHLDGPAGVGQFNLPMRMGGVDGAGNVYVLDTGDWRIRKITPDGVISTVAGTGVAGFSDGPAATAQFSSDILGLTVDRGGTLYVMDAGNRRIRRVTPDGMVSTLFEVTDPNQTPGNIKLDPAGNVYLSDRQHNVIYRLPAR